MTLLRTFRAHTGGLIRLKEELYWRGGAGWDGTPDRICLVLDATDLGTGTALTAAGAAAATAAVAAPYTVVTLAVLLLIDGCPQWVWIDPEDVELIT